MQTASFACAVVLLALLALNAGLVAASVPKRPAGAAPPSPAPAPAFVPLPDALCKPMDAAGGKDAKCIAAKGRCYDSSESGCLKCDHPEGYVAGLCAGNADRKCCKGKAYRKSPSLTSVPTTPATVKTRSGPGRVTLFTWDKLVAAYPQGTADEVKGRLGGGVNASYITNTCAVRMSYTLGKLGVLITPANTKGMATVVAGDKQRVLLRVRELAEFVKKPLGAPTVALRTKADIRPDNPLIHGKRGIIKFVIQWSDATGHFDLWDGFCMAEASHVHKTKEYFDRATEVDVWIIDDAPAGSKAKCSYTE